MQEINRYIKKEIEKCKRQIELAQEGRFKEVNFIGGGGYAWVFQVYDGKRGCKVAIKIPQKGTDSKTDIVDEGLKVACLCPHKNIVQIYEFFRYEGEKRALVMEYGGTNLRKLLGRLKGNVDIAIKIMIDICQALKQAHEYKESILHRDVKPENIVITLDPENDWENATAKLTDFGIAIEVNMGNPEVVGSLPYMAPEQIKHGKPDVRWDLYSATVVFYEMIQGTTPFNGETQSLIQQIMHQSPPPLRHGIPMGLKRIIYKGLEKDPTKRYQTASDMLCDLEVFQYFDTQIIKVVEQVEQQLTGRYPAQKVFFKLGEMYTDLSIDTLSHLQEEFNTESPNPSICFRLALLHGAINDYDEAENNIRETQHLDMKGKEHPFNQDHAFIKRFTTSSKKKKTSEKEESPDKDDNDYRILVEKVNQLLINGELQEARKLTKEILNSINTPEIYIRFCEVFYEEAIFDYVIELCKDGLTFHQNCAELFAFLGKALYEKDPERAKQAMEKAKEFGCKDPEIEDLLKYLIK